MIRGSLPRRRPAPRHGIDFGREADGGDTKHKLTRPLSEASGGRHLRGHRGALGELDAARPSRRDRGPRGKSPQAETLYIDCGEKDQFNLLYGARRFVRRLNNVGIAHRHEEFPDNHTGVLPDELELAASRAGHFSLMCLRRSPNTRPMREAWNCRMV
jgi:hypothetical protein